MLLRPRHGVEGPTRFGTLRWGTLVWAALLATCCEAGPRADDGGLDAGRDASRPALDAPRPDAPRDVGTDVGTDARYEGDPEFVPLPLPGVTDARDVVLRARHPERFPVAAWYPCLGSVPSCRQMERVATRARAIRIYRTARGLWAWMMAVSATREVYDAIGPLEGPLAGIWRRPLRNIVGGGASFGAAWHVASEGSAAFAVKHNHEGHFDERVYVAPLEEIGAVEEPRYVVDMRVSGRGFQRMWVNDDHVLAEVQPDLSLYLWRLDQDTFRVVDDRVAVPGLPQNEFLVGGRVFYEAWASLDETRLAMTSWEGPTRSVVDIDPDDVKGFATDGVDLAWLQLYDRDEDGDYARIELWTMPFSEEPDLADARLVDAAFPYRVEALVGGGWYVYYWREPEEIGRVVLHPLHGGPQRYFQTPDGANVTALLYVDATNLFVRSGPDLYWVDPRELPEP